MIKHIHFTLAFLLYAAASFAQKQNTESKHPCLLPVLELYNEQKEKLAEGAIPSGKITLRLQKNQSCTEGVKYEVLEVYLVAVRGFKPIGKIEVDGNAVDLSEMESEFVAGDRLVLILKAKYTTAKGKTGEMSSSHNWGFKTKE